MKDLCQQVKGSALEPESDAQSKDQDSLKTTTAILNDSEIPNSSDSKYSQIHTGKASVTNFPGKPIAPPLLQFSCWCWQQAWGGPSTPNAMLIQFSWVLQVDHQLSVHHSYNMGMFDHSRVYSRYLRIENCHLDFQPSAICPYWASMGKPVT